MLSGESESDEPSDAENDDSDNKEDDLVTSKRLKIHSKASVIMLKSAKLYSILSLSSCFVQW